MAFRSPAPGIAAFDFDSPGAMRTRFLGIPFQMELEMRLYSYKDLRWHGSELCFGRRAVATIERDGEYPELWRVRLPSGHLTDMINLSRARDAAVCLALLALNEQRAE